jgi:Zn-dependent alcohol dehydrogenase
VTTFNEYAVVSENRLTPIPADFDLRLAPLFGWRGGTTGFGVVNNDAQVKIGQSVAVFGVGGVGLCVVQAAALGSAYPIVAIDIHDNHWRWPNNLRDPRIQFANLPGPRAERFARWWARAAWTRRLKPPAS